MYVFEFPLPSRVCCCLVLKVLNLGCFSWRQVENNVCGVCVKALPVPCPPEQAKNTLAEALMGVNLEAIKY